MICKNNECKAELPDDAVFCLKCGTKQDVAESAKNSIETQNDITKADTSDFATANKPTKKHTPLIVAISIIAVIVLIFAAAVTSAPRVPSTNSNSKTTVSTSVEPHKYPMERCPIEVTDISVTEEENINKTKLSAKWTYNVKHDELVIDKVIFTFTSYDADGQEHYHSPSRFTAEGPFTDDTLYENSWLTPYSFESAGVQNIKIYYSNNIIEEYVEVTYETKPETQPTPTETKAPIKTIEDCPIKVTSCYPSAPNSADGVSLYINWYSEDTKEIKYIRFFVTPYNRVNDKQTCEIRDYSTVNGEVVGPFNHGDSDSSYWDCAWYNSSIDHVELERITIEYMDGTFATYEQR